MFTGCDSEEEVITEPTTTQTTVITTAQTTEPTTEATTTPTTTIPTTISAQTSAPTPETTVPSEISRSGWITEDETWSGIVHITGDVWVDAEITLTILPGTTIMFAAHQDDQHNGFAVPLDEWIARHDDPTWTLEWAQSHCKLDVYGTLIARGTPDDMIVFTSDSLTPDGGDWLHVHIGNGSFVEFCVIEYSRGGLDVMEGTGDSVKISNNIIRHNFWTALTIHTGSSPTVTYNEIYDSGGHQGIAVIGEGSAPYIAYNNIRECKGGINIQPGTAPIVEYNTLIDNDGGIGLLETSASAVVRYNSISAPNGPTQNWTYKGEPVYFSSILLGRNDAISGISVADCSPIITYNGISLCNSAGINIMGNSSPTINHNMITDCYAGFLLDESFTGSPSIEENNIYDNTYANILIWSEQPIIATNNWWGTTDLAEIQAKILSTQGQPALGLVIFEPFLPEPVNIE